MEEQQPIIQQNKEREEKPVAIKEAQNLQDFDYLLILDFEATCSQTEKYTVQEIIEFPIVILNVKTNTILKEEFHYYIKPSRHPILSAFCKDLTKIKQEQVDAGIYLEEALIKVDEFIHKQGLIGQKFTFVCCGDFDLGKCLTLEARFKGIDYPSYLKSYINIKKIFPKEWYQSVTHSGKEKTLGMAGMLRVLKLELEGTHHSGIDDSRNIARIAQELIRQGVVFSKKVENTVAAIENNPKNKLKEKKKH